MIRRLTGEGLGTAGLLYVVVGSGIVAETLGIDPAGRLLAHALAVGLGLGVFIALFQMVSGSHFNPAVTLAFWSTRNLTAGEAVGYVAAQTVGAIAGTVVAHLSFGMEVVSISTTVRSGLGMILSEAIATFTLVLVILGFVGTGRLGTLPIAVGAWVTVVIFATASTGFANPAATIARILTDTYTGIAPSSVIGFLIAQVGGGLAAAAVASRLVSGSKALIEEEASWR